MKNICLILLFLLASAFADGPKDNQPENVRQIPKEGIKLSEEQKLKISNKLSHLKSKLIAIQASTDQRLNQLLPDVEIFYKAVHYCLNHNEFLFEKEIAWADEILDKGLERANNLLKGKAPWLTQKGYIVRGFRSKIDQSVQPYGLIIPQSYEINGSKNHRLDIWLHGRGEKQLELGFIRARMGKAKDKFQSKDTIMLHPYGRYSNAFKFAGEIDVFEALEHAKKWYRVDEDRIANRGFSMGGAGCWQLAVHYADQWFASNPGAGFSETPEFLKHFQKQDLKPTWYEKVLWRWYDCPDYSANLKQSPTIAYSGEDDIQIQAAQMMEQGFANEGMTLRHIIGPKTKHKYHPDSAKTVENWLHKQAINGRNTLPLEIDFVTFTLKYNKMHWLTIDRLTQHFEKSRITAKVKPQEIHFKTQNINSFHINFEERNAPFHTGHKVTFIIDNQKLEDLIGPRTNKKYKIHFTSIDGKWSFGSPVAQLAKKKDLQGPIDDAFMNRFIFVKPTGTSQNQKFQKWSESELQRAIKHWRQHFRGDAIVKTDTEITEKDIQQSNLILWGDTDSNAVIRQLQSRLPIKWNEDQITTNKKSYSSNNHALVMIYPNPLNPQKYIVLNSSFTFREFAYLNNARQVPMLPDWAIINLDTKPGFVWPGKVADANFFDESWQLKK
ncbi:MAG: hypothetical protein NE334_06730 [Lentisphaeraceae bacterium]|nr:hypothetical protein [Lentisphaeraceae bacterium]